MEQKKQKSLDEFFFFFFLLLHRLRDDIISKMSHGRLLSNLIAPRQKRGKLMSIKALVF